MKLSKRFLLCSLFILIAVSSIMFSGCVETIPDDTIINQSEIVITDGLGNELTFSSPPQRIAVAGADIATVLLMIGAQGQVIGVGESVKKDPQISSYYFEKESLGESSTPNPEKIVSLKPDLILVYASSQPSNIENIKKTGIPIGYFDCYKQNRLFDDIVTLGKITGKETQANELADYIKKITSLVTQKIKDIQPSERVSVYFEIGDYTAAANQSGGDYVITTAGGKNIAESTAIQWVKVTPEWIIYQNPEVIIKNVYIESGENLESIRNQIINRSGFSSVRAVQSGRVYAFNSDILYGAQSCIALIYVAKILYPELFSDINPDQYLDDFSGKFYPEGNLSLNVYPQVN